MGCNATQTKTPESFVFAKRKPAFKIRIDSLRAKAVAGPANQAKESSQKRPKTVRFGPRSKIFFHSTKSELEQAWYRSKDYADFKTDSKSTLQALKQAQGNVTHLDASRHCIRGLEAHVSPDMLRLRQMRIRSTVQVVLDQQKSQRCYGVSDPNMIGAVSMMFSKQARQRALYMGALDNSFRWYI